MCSATQAAERPNIVMIISDDQAWNDYGFMRHEAIETPHLDRLAAESVVFERGYVPTGLCRPSLMTLITGLYAYQHKTTGNDPSPSVTDPKSPAYDEQREKLIAHVDQHP
ncbi:MAG TPA: sulfatase-like hydrolase/transferase, partial [Pirellulaceae bacterium]|nr:sulfatase-like hydrolase/transferase [Pirellulaceae bacterium]